MVEMWLNLPVLTNIATESSELISNNSRRLSTLPNAFVDDHSTADTKTEDLIEINKQLDQSLENFANVA